MSHKSGMLLLLPLLAVVLIISGCGKGNDNNASTGVYISVTPAHGATRISVLTGVHMAFNVDLNASTITTSTVTLKRGDISISGTVNYDAATKSITFLPTNRLGHARNYTFYISGVQDTSGKTLPVIVSSFRTLHNYVERETFYDSISGDVVSYYQHFFDTNGNITRSNHYTGYGTDQIWFTSDDTMDYYSLYYYDLNNFNYGYVRYNLANTVSFYEMKLPNVNGDTIRFLNYSSRGNDKVWFTNDDDLLKYTDYYYYTNGNRDYYVNYSGPGPGASWFSGSDKISSIGFYLYSSNSLIRFKNYTGPGVDNNWSTTNDNYLASYSEYEWNLDHTLHKITNRSSIGAVTSTEEYHYDADLNITYYEKFDSNSNRSQRNDYNVLY